MLLADGRQGPQEAQEPCGAGDEKEPTSHPDCLRSGTTESSRTCSEGGKVTLEGPSSDPYLPDDRRCEVSTVSLLIPVPVKEKLRLRG